MKSNYQTRDMSKSNWRQLKVYDVDAYQRFVENCRLKNTSATRRLNEFIMNEVKGAHNGKR